MKLINNQRFFFLNLNNKTRLRHDWSLLRLPKFDQLVGSKGPGGLGGSESLGGLGGPGASDPKVYITEGASAQFPIFSMFGHM